MVAILKGLKRFRTRILSTADGDKTGISRHGVDPTRLPSGHFACHHCDKPWFHIYMDKENSRFIASCAKCGADMNIILPMDTIIPIQKTGVMYCINHKHGQWAIIKCDKRLSVGCKDCKSEINIELNLISPILLPGGIN